MKTMIEDGHLVIRIPLLTPPEPSASGKTQLLASTRGNKRCGLQVEGKPVYLGLTAYVYTAPRNAGDAQPTSEPAGAGSEQGVA
jgi:hypothetical protein